MDARRVVLVLIVAGAVWNPSPVAAQTWSSNNSAAPASTYDRYGQPVAPTAPSITQRTQSAFTDTGTAVRDGVEAGIRAAEQGYNNVSGQAATSFSAPASTNATTSAPRSAVSSPWPSTSATSSTPPPAPGWASNASNTPPAPTTRTAAPNITAIDGGWTTIGNAAAPPPLLIPQPPTTTSNFGLSNQTTGTRTATNASTVTSNEIQPLHSILADPSRPSASATSPTSTAPPAASAAAIGPPDNWATGWNDNTTTPTATIGAGTRTNPTGTTAPAASGSTVSKASDGWPDSNPWAQPSLGAANGTTSANRPASTGTATSSQFPTNTTQPTGQFAGQTNFQTPAGQPAGNFGASSSNPNSSQMTMGGTLPPIERGQTKAATTEPQPWMPLIASVLVLAGSLAANLYLGVSYLDARQKYQSLVRKTADTFRRVKAVAA